MCITVVVLFYVSLSCIYAINSISLLSIFFLTTNNLDWFCRGCVDGRDAFIEDVFGVLVCKIATKLSLRQSLYLHTVYIVGWADSAVGCISCGVVCAKV